MRKSMIFLTTTAFVAGLAATIPATARDQSSRTALSANQIVDQVDARAANIKADLKLTPEQEKNWAGFASAMNSIGKKQGDRQTALLAEQANQKSPPDVIDRMRSQAKFMSERAADRKTLADAAQPLYASLDERQKQRFGEELMDLGRRQNTD